MQKVLNKLKNFKITRKVYAYPYVLFLLFFVVLPLVLILVNAFMANGKLSMKNFIDFFSASAGLNVLGKSILVGFITTFICLLLGYPAAYILAKQTDGRALVLLFMLPMWINFLIRTLATKAIFEAIDVSLGWGTVIFGMVYNYLPFMILPLHSTLSGIDKCYEEAAQDLGADPVTVFVKTTLPMSLSGIISGITMVFVPTISTFAITELLSNNQIYLFGDSIQRQFNFGYYGIGSVMSIIMLALVLVSNYFMNKFNKGAVSKGRNLW